MTDLTISISDELMEKLRPHLTQLPRLLERVVVEAEQEVTPKPLTERERIVRLLAEKGIKPLDRNLLPKGILNRPRQKPLVIPGKPVSEIIIEH